MFAIRDDTFSRRAIVGKEKKVPKSGITAAPGVFRRFIHIFRYLSERIVEQRRWGRPSENSEKG